jgi:hypothetical protein
MAALVWLHLFHSKCITRVLEEHSRKIFVALATLVLVTAGPSYAQPLRSTSIPSSLADDEKRLLPEVMNEFYGSFDKEKHPFSFDKEEKGCWISTKSGPQPEAAPYMWGSASIKRLPSM